jgi:hypothetical protein
VAGVFGVLVVVLLGVVPIAARLVAAREREGMD